MYDKYSLHRRAFIHFLNMINYNVNASNYASQANTNLKFVKGTLNVISQIG